MLFRNITLVDENFQIRKNQFVGVKNDRIAYIGACAPTEDYGQVFEGANKLLIPSFYNMHSHLPMYFLRGFGENLPLMDWLNTRIFPFEAQLTEDDMYFGALMGAAESLRFGIGATNEMYLRHRPLGKALFESGLKANFSACCTCFDGSDYRDLPNFRETLLAIEEFDGADSGRLQVDFSLHAEYTSTERVVRGFAEAVQKVEKRVHLHLSETAGEVADCRARHEGRSPVQYFADCGVFAAPTVAAHGVHLSGEDRAILKESGVTVASCPKSNAKLGSGVCPVGDLLKTGVNVAIGTDSVASNNNLNLLEELRFFNLLQKAVTADPTVLTPEETLFAATRAGALAQGRADSGLVKEGFKADLTVFDLSGVTMKPDHDLLANLIYAANGTDVVLTMVDGRVLYQNGVYTTLDIEKIQFECEKICHRIVAKL